MSIELEEKKIDLPVANADRNKDSGNKRRKNEA